MTKVTYLSHSGYAVTLDNVVLVFDYLHDPSHALKHILDAHPDIPVVFFISHQLVNNNHFNPGTFEIAQNHRRVYVVSNSLPAKYIPSTLDVAGMSAGDVVDTLPGGITVRAYGAKNHDVSFMVTTADGRHIFHAGNLNRWDMPDETDHRQVQKNEAHFKSVVNRIAEDVPVVDIAMFPVDTRISLDFAQGAREFLNTIDVKDFFPTDIDGNVKDACDFATYVPSRTTAHCMHDPGQSITLDKVAAPAH